MPAAANGYEDRDDRRRGEIDLGLAAGGLDEATDGLAMAYASLQACGCGDLAGSIPAVLMEVRRLRRQVGGPAVRVVGGHDPADWYLCN
jgi:hypothetical protein